MRIRLFYHSLISDWNHGNAHFLRGVARQLIRLGHEVTIYEPAESWSVTHLVDDQGPAAANAYREAYPELQSEQYDPADVDLSLAVDDADLVIVHEWNDPALVAAIGRYVADRRDRLGRENAPRLLFHDTHHRCVSKPAEIEQYQLDDYDGVLAFGDVVRQTYLRHGWTRRAWTWHEAADTTVFHPIPDVEPTQDLVWIGNWGDEERSEELRTYLIEPVRRLGLKATIYGVRYPDDALHELEEAGITYGGYLLNHRVPEVFARHRVTVHVPRRPYTRQLPGIPTIRPFEAMACGIPLVSAPWEDREHLFRVGEDFDMVDSGDAMTAAIDRVLRDPDHANQLRQHGLQTIRERHTCGHRALQLLSIARELDLNPQADRQPATA